MDGESFRKMYPFDLKKAGELMAEAGYADGFTVTLDTTNNRYVNDQQIAQALASMLGKIKIDLKLNLMPKSNFFGYIRVPSNQSSLIMSGWDVPSGDGGSMYSVMFYSRGKKEGYGQVNRGSYSNPEVDALIDKADGTAKLEERDAHLQAVTKILMRDIPMIPIHYEQDLYAAKKNVELTPRADKFLWAYEIGRQGIKLAAFPSNAPPATLVGGALSFLSATDGTTVLIGYLIKRLLQMALVLFAVSVIVFLMMSFTGDPVFMVIPIDSTAAEIEQARRLLGLDRSLLSQYWIFVTNLLQGDFGRSYVFRQPAMDLILERLPATIEMVLVAITLATIIAVPLGVFAGANPNRPISRGMMAGSLLGISLPGFWVGMMLIFFFSVRYQFLPSSGRGETVQFLGLRVSILTGDGWSHIILPAITLALATLAIILRITRAGMMEVMRQDYIRFARAKGASRRHHPVQSWPEERAHSGRHDLRPSTRRPDRVRHHH